MKIKRFTAVCIAIIMLLGSMPAIVFALPSLPGDFPPLRQRPVTRSEIQVGPASGGGTYHLNIRWERPPRSTVSDLRSGITETRLVYERGQGRLGLNIWSLYPTSYDVRIRNASAGDGFGVDPRLTIPPHTPTLPAPDGQGVRAAALLWENFTGSRPFSLQPASFYEVEILPRRNVPALGELPPDAPPEALRPVVGVPATLDTTIPTRGMLFLTDIRPLQQGVEIPLR